MPFTKDNAAQLGARGGRRTVEKHGRGWMRSIGKLGFAKTVQRYWNGDRQAYTKRLAALGFLSTDSYDNGATAAAMRNVEALEQQQGREVRFERSPWGGWRPVRKLCGQGQQDLV